MYTRPVASVAIIAPHRLISGLIKVAFVHAPDIEVVAQAVSADDLRETLTDTVPSVVMMEFLQSTTENTQAAIRAVLSTWPTAAVIIVVESEDSDLLFDALAVGACGFVTLHSPLVDLYEAVKRAAAHEMVLSPEFARQLLGEMRWRTKPERAAAGAAQLTSRELEVLRLVAQGHSNQQIAREMNVSASTVKNHLYSCYQKIGVTSRSQAVAQAVKMRLLSL